MAHSPKGTPMRIQAGTLIAHRLIDVADAIDLARAESAWQRRHGDTSRRTRLTTVAPNELAFEAPPLQVELESITFELEGREVTARVSARLYDFGAIALAVHVAVSDLDWDAFVQRCNALDRTLGPAAASPLWDKALRTVRDTIGDALHRPAQAHLEEDYLYAVVRRTEPALDAAQFQSSVDLASLLSGETRPLSSTQRAELTGKAFSYYVDDLVMLTWDRAVVLSPHDDLDVVDIIEVANAQLLEMRYYDALMDSELTKMNDLVFNARGGLSLMASRRCAALARRVHGLVAEVTALTSKVENTLQVTEDVYLARVHSHALELFRVQKLSQSVHRKLAIASDTYAALYDEASTRRAELLELAIVLLIVFEIVLALVRH